MQDVNSTRPLECVRCTEAHCLPVSSVLLSHPRDPILLLCLCLILTQLSHRLREPERAQQSKVAFNMGYKSRREAK